MKFLPALVCALLLSTACKKTQESAKETARERAKETFPAATAASVDQQMERAVQKGLIPGAVVVIGHNGQVVYQKAYGSRALIPQREPMTLDTIFDAASLTKVIATTPSIMRLFEQGQIRLNDPVTNYLPEFQGGHSDITIRNLMTHFSGLRPDLDLQPHWSGYDTKVWQFPVILIPLGAGNAPDSVVLRPVDSVDGMTAQSVLMDDGLLREMCREILKIAGVSAVFYDLTHKPPGTIEWE